MDKDKLIDILSAHKKWLDDEIGGIRADLRGADLRDADLRDADLRGAYLCGANLCGADLRGADLRGADLRDADLRGAYLCGANLRDADLRGADLRDANLCDANNYWLQCPETGSFIAYKKANGYIVELKIPASALRSSATSRKCRCSKAKVLSITNIDGSKCHLTEINSNFDLSFIYKVGETVEVPNFDKDRWNECSTGIHFFITRQEAVDY